VKVTTRKRYPFRSFYEGKKRVAFYVINVVGEEPTISIYSDYIKESFDSLALKKSDIENDEFRAWEYLAKHLPKRLAEAIMKMAKKDLKCKKGFSLKSYISWKKQR